MESHLGADDLDALPLDAGLPHPCRRESLIMRLVASAPLLQKKTRPGPA